MYSKKSQDVHALLKVYSKRIYAILFNIDIFDPSSSMVIISLSSVHSNSLELHANFKHPTRIQRFSYIQFFSNCYDRQGSIVWRRLTTCRATWFRKWRRERGGCNREFNYTIAHLSGKGYYFPLDYNLVIKFVAALPHSFVVVSSRWLFSSIITRPRVCH